MAFAFKRSTKTLFATSLTTAAVFYTCSYNILPIRCFCIYSSLVVLSHFVVYIVMMPPMIVIHERYMVKNTCCRSKSNSVYSVDNIIKRESCLERIFSGSFNTIIRKLRWLIFIILIIWIVYAGFVISEIGPTSFSEQYLSPTDKIIKAKNTIKSKFTPINLHSQKVNIYWGVRGKNGN